MSKTTSRPTMRRANSCGSVSLVWSSAVTRPSRMTVTSSATSITSSSLWVMNRMVLPASLSRPRTSKKGPVSLGVSTLVGSSRIRMSALRYSNFRISTRCCMPMGSFQTGSEGSMSKPKERLSSLRRAPCSASPSRIAPCLRPRMTFSVTVNGPTSMKCWCTMPMPCLRAPRGPLMATSRPAITMRPWSGS